MRRRRSPTTSWSPSASKVLVAQARRDSRSRTLAVPTVARGGERGARDIGREDPHGRRRRGERLAREERERVCLLAGCAGSAPDADFLGAGCPCPLEQRSPRDRIELLAVAEEEGLLDRHLVEQPGDRARRRRPGWRPDAGRPPRRRPAARVRAPSGGPDAEPLAQDAAFAENERGDLVECTLIGRLWPFERDRRQGFGDPSSGRIVAAPLFAAACGIPNMAEVSSSWAIVSPPAARTAASPRRRRGPCRSARSPRLRSRPHCGEAPEQHVAGRPVRACASRCAIECEQAVVPSGSGRPPRVRPSTPGRASRLPPRARTGSGTVGVEPAGESLRRSRQRCAGRRGLGSGTSAGMPASRAARAWRPARRRADSDHRGRATAGGVAARGAVQARAGVSDHLDAAEQLDSPARARAPTLPGLAEREVPFPHRVERSGRKAARRASASGARRGPRAPDRGRVARS